MVYKLKETVYFPNEKSHDDFMQRVESSKTTKSKYILGLIEKDITDRAEPQEEPFTVAFAPTFTRVMSFEYSEGFNLNLLHTLKHTVKNQIAATIDEKIMSRVYDYLVDQGQINEGMESAFIVVKYKLDICYSVCLGDNGYEILVMFSYKCGIISLSESLWREFGGLYDFTKISYMSYKDFFTTENKGKRMVPLHDLARQDDSSGGFFIPVSDVEKYYPRNLEKSGFTREFMGSSVFIKVTGVGMNDRKGRLSYQRIDQGDSGVIKMHDKITRMKI